MSIVEWPSPDLVPLAPDYWISNRSRTGGESLSGFEQISDPITNRWRASLEFNNLKREFVPAWRAMIAALAGRTNVLRIPLFDPKYRPTDAEIGATDATHSDDTTFADGSLYSAHDIDGINVSGSAGVKTLDIDFGSYGEIFSGGQYLGIGDEAYHAKTVSYAGSVATINFEPALRRDHTNSQVRLRPRMLMRLADDDQGRLPLRLGVTAAPSLELIEVLPGELSAEELAQL